MFNCSAKHGYICVKPEGEVRPCCRWKGFSPPLDMFETFEDILDYYQKTIPTPSKTWPQGCISCYNDVSSSRKSEMEVLNEIIEQTGNTIQYLEVGFDNVCNMNCVMCSTQYSSRWDKLYKNNKEFLSKYILEYNSPPLIYDNIIRLLENSDISRLHTIKLMGGEPMYSKASLKFLEWFTNKDVSNIELKFTTNATIFPKKYLDLFKKFKRVTPKTSIDGINEVGEWGRNSDVPFKKIEEVVGLWNEYAKQNNNIELRNNTTITLVNIEHLGTLSKWLSNYDQFTIKQISIAAMNNYISPLVVSRKIRQLLWQEQNILYNDMKLYTRHETLLNAHQQQDYPVKNVIDYIEWYDTLNKNKFKDISPKIWKALNDIL